MDTSIVEPQTPACVLGTQHLTSTGRTDTHTKHRELQGDGFWVFRIQVEGVQDGMRHPSLYQTQGATGRQFLSLSGPG